jgi:phage terminase large subunit-like protein
VSSQQLKDTLASLEAASAHRRFNKNLFWKPYPKQKEFLDLGRLKRERLFMAGNQVGKSDTGAMETSTHLTGLYPDWWQGKVFTKPVIGWAAGETSLVVRDVQQDKLCGPHGVDAEFGTGLIPKDQFADKPSLARGVTDAYDTIQVIHSVPVVKKGTYIKVPSNDGISQLTFKSYEQGRQKFQGKTIDFGWGDEEPPMEVFEEFLARLTGEGIMFTTFTPLLGRTALVNRYLDEKSADRGVVSMTLDEAEHFTPEQKAQRLAGYRRHMREARALGVPLQGEGLVFDFGEDLLKEARIENVPPYWRKLWGIDFGIGHPFAAVLLLWDVDNDCIHVHHCIRMVSDERASLPMHHAAAMKPIGINVPVAWPQDGTAREKGSGDPLATLYKAQRLRMLPTHATWEDGSVSTEAGILEMEQRMATGRFKVASHLSDWFEEYRTYHRKDGQIVKVRDDLMSATRVAIMAKRFSKAVGLGGGLDKRRDRPTFATDVDFSFDW